MKNRILLRGYYGFANFGDDILMLASFNFLSSLFNKRDILIQSKQKESAYITKLIPESGSDFSTQERMDLIFHGGGGVYFDFKDGNIFDRIVNCVIRIVGGSLFSTLITAVRIQRNIQIERSKIRVGVGIGVGSFTDSSSKLRSSIVELSDFDKILVRDEASVKNFKNWNRKIDATLSSDLAFASYLWLPDFAKKKQAKKKIGIVLRNWIHDPSIQNNLMIQVKDLHSQGYLIEFFLFDKNEDISLLNLLKGFCCHIWDPLSSSVENYLDKIDGMSMVITTRAHGAIVAAILEIPSVIVEIEPKLRNVHNMIPNGSLIVSDLEFLLEKTIFMLDNIDEFTIGLRNDVEKNQNIVREDLLDLKSFINKKIRS